MQSFLEERGYAALADLQMAKNKHSGLAFRRWANLTAGVKVTEKERLEVMRSRLEALTEEGLLQTFTKEQLPVPTRSGPGTIYYTLDFQALLETIYKEAKLKAKKLWGQEIEPELMKFLFEHGRASLNDIRTLQKAELGKKKLLVTEWASLRILLCGL